MKVLLRAAKIQGKCEKCGNAEIWKLISKSFNLHVTENNPFALFFNIAN